MSGMTRALPRAIIRTDVARNTGALVFLGLLGLWVTIYMPGYSFLTSVAAAVTLGVATWMFFSERYELTLAILILYLGIADGYLKLKTGATAATLGRDVLLYAIALGALARSVIRQEKLVMPPLTGWVAAFTLVALVQVANPGSYPLGHGLPALRPHLEFVPLFFLAYMVMRSRQRLRIFLLLMLLCGAANGVVSLIQFNLSPSELAGWGPGYRERIEGEGVAGRTFSDGNDVDRVRPFGLGSDSGVGGVWGMIALPAGLALLTLARRRKVEALIAGVLSAGAVLAIVTSQGRASVVAAFIAVSAYVLLTVSRRRIVPTVVALLTGALVAMTVISVVTADQGGAFARYDSISPGRVFSTARDERGGSLRLAVNQLSKYPLGAGLGHAGPATGFGGGERLLGISGETEFSFLVAELGIAGLIILIPFVLILIFRAARRVRAAPDLETRVLLAAVCAPLVGIFATFFSASASAVSPSSPYLWFSAGIFAWWIKPGSGLTRRSSPIEPQLAASPPALLSYEPPAPQRARALPEPALFGHSAPSPPRAEEPPVVEDTRVEDLRVADEPPVVEEPALEEVLPVQEEPAFQDEPFAEETQPVEDEPVELPAAEEPFIEEEPVEPPAAAEPFIEEDPVELPAAEEPVFEDDPFFEEEPPPAVPDVAPEPRTPVIALVYRDTKTRIDGIRAYTERLADAVDSTGELEARPIFSRKFGEDLDGATAAVVQYNPFSYGRYGFAPWLPRALRKLRARPNPPVVAVMVHEAYAHVTNPRSALISSWQRLQLRSILRNADVAFTATEALALKVDDLDPRCPVRHLPVGSNLPDGRHMRNVERRALGVRDGELVLAAFGTGHPSQLGHYLVNAANAVASERPGVVFLNLGAGVNSLKGLADNIRLVEPGELDVDRLAAMLSAADLFLAPFVDGVSTRRTTLMAALQHGLPVVGTEARQTDEILRTSRAALRLVPAGAQRTFITAARELSRDDSGRRAMAVEARALYDAHFHWDRIQAALVEELYEASARG
jgi:glycosyltransferase involved in cell wall biosynthesis